MSNDELPEAYLTAENQHVVAPTYELLGDCHMPMYSADTGQTGPTLVLAGEVITSELTPSHAWRPLNRAAGERMEIWLSRLAAMPGSSQGFSMDEIAEAATAMRPRSGEPELPHDQWWAAVMKYAAGIKEKRKGISSPANPVSHRPGHSANLPVMPNAAIGSGGHVNPGGPPPNVATHQPDPARQAQRQRRAATTPAMPGVMPANSPQAVG